MSTCSQTNKPTINQVVDSCKGFHLSTKCIYTDLAITYISITAGSSLENILQALTQALQNSNTRISVLEATVDEINPTPYKTYTALVTQTGDFQSLNKLNGFTIGEKYFVNYLAPGDDFENVGFLEVNSLFIATGTTATTWTSSGVRIFDEDVLPVLSVLDNSLDITLTPEFNEINNPQSSFILVSNLPLFLENKTTLSPYAWGDTNNVAQAKGLFRVDNSTLILGQINPFGGYKPFRIEIKVYN